jgi:hypothetical protein
MLSELIAWLRLLAQGQRWSIFITSFLIVVGLAWKIVVDAHTFSWLFEKLHLVRRAEPAITHPRNRDVVYTPITVRGTHHNQTGNYWLVTNDGRNNYWPKRRIYFQPDEQWDEQINTAEGQGQTATIWLVKVTDLLQDKFEDWQRNANRTGNWSGLPLTQEITRKNLRRVHAIVVTVAQRP